jgi:lysophospholipase L1-like esterase
MKLRNILLSVAVLFITLCFLEGALFLFDTLGFFPNFYSELNKATPDFERKTGPGLYYAHPYISYEIKPDYKSKQVQINSLGYRGRSFSAKKPEGVYRVIALGASTTYGIYNQQNRTYPFLLEKKLQEDLHTKNIEVINAGLVSATTTESLIRFSLRIAPLEPDMIIIYHGYNDLVPRMFNDFSGDYFHYRKIMKSDFHIYEKLYLYKIFNAALLRRINEKVIMNQNLLHYTWKFDNLPDIPQRVENFNATSSDVFKRNFKDIITLARAADIQVVLMTFAFDDQQKNWNNYMPDELWGKGIRENNLVVKALAEQYDLPLVKFYEYGESDRRIFADSIHMNEYGNLKKAELIAQEIEPILEEAGFASPIPKATLENHGRAH